MAGGKLPPRDGDEPAQETAAPAAPVETGRACRERRAR